MSRHDFVEPYYMVQLSDGDLQEMQTYISKLKDRDYHHREIIHNNPIHSQGRHSGWLLDWRSYKRDALFCILLSAQLFRTDGRARVAGFALPTANRADRALRRHALREERPPHRAKGVEV